MEFFPVPEEIKAQILEHLDRHQMSHTSTQHDIQRMFGELSIEHLKILGGIFNAIAQEGSRSGAWLEGMVSGALYYKHEYCPSCGAVHGDEFHAEMPKIGEAPVEKIVALSRDEFIEKCAEYNVTPKEESEGVTCNGCGVEYVSLEDRMLKRPDTCSGCQQRARWG